MRRESKMDLEVLLNLNVIKERAQSLIPKARSVAIYCVDNMIVRPIEITNLILGNADDEEEAYIITIMVAQCLVNWQDDHEAYKKAKQSHYIKATRTPSSLGRLNLDDIAEARKAMSDAMSAFPQRVTSNISIKVIDLIDVSVAQTVFLLLMLVKQILIENPQVIQHS